MYHTIIIVGNVGKDPEMRYTPSGQPVCNFSVAATRNYTRGEEKVDETTWARVTTWGKQAEICNQYVKKGNKVLVEGRLTADPATGGPRVWTGKEGSPRASFEVTANTVRFLSSRSDSEGHGTDMDAGGSFVGAPDEDIPF